MTTTVQTAPMIGPASTVSIQLIPPVVMPPEWIWDITITDIPGENIVLRQQAPGCGGTLCTMVLGIRDPGMGLSGPTTLALENASVAVNARVFDQVGVMVGSEQLTGYRWATSGQYFVDFRIQGQTGGDGFTTTDREVLLSTQSSVTKTMAVSDVTNAFRNIPIGELLPGPPANVLIKTAPIQISGSGSLFRPPVGPAVNAYGAIWSWFTVPQFFGRKPGAAIEYEARMLQVVVVREDAGSDLYMAQLEDSSVEGGYYLWGAPIPSRIDYNVAPGVVVSWQWLILPLGQ